MKKIIPFLIVLFTLTIPCTNTYAQKDTSNTFTYKTWDDFLAKIKREKNPKVEAVIKLAESDPKFKIIRDQSVARINESLSASQSEEPWKDYVPAYQHKPGDMNLLPFLEEVPSPVYILPQAAQTDVNARFDPYFKKIESQQKQIADLSMNNGLQRVYQ